MNKNKYLKSQTKKIIVFFLTLILTLGIIPIHQAKAASNVQLSSNGSVTYNGVRFRTYTDGNNNTFIYAKSVSSCTTHTIQIKGLRKNGAYCYTAITMSESDKWKTTITVGRNEIQVASLNKDSAQAVGQQNWAGATLEVGYWTKGSNHSYSEYKISDATCTTAATYARKCIYCSSQSGSSYTKGSALGHNYDEGIVTKDATSLSEGEITKHCVRCGETHIDKIPRIVIKAYLGKIPLKGIAEGKNFIKNIT